MTKTRLLQITKALADARRFDLLGHVASARGEISCIDVRAKLRAKRPISRATMSHHIRELTTAGLIEARRESRYMFLRMRRKTWVDYLEHLRKISL
jgi:ArsR family transcriptional regulator